MLGNKNKNLEFDINLMPVISILAVVLSILLLTTVWVRVGTFNVNQALGTETVDKKKNPPALWVQFLNDGDLRLVVKDANLAEKLTHTSINKRTAKERMASLRSYAQNLRKLVPEMQVALILPAPTSSYQDVIAVMDVLKKEKFSDLGVAPL